MEQHKNLSNCRPFITFKDYEIINNTKYVLKKSTLNFVTY